MNDKTIGRVLHPFKTDTEFNILRAFGATSGILWKKSNSKGIIKVLGERNGPARYRTREREWVSIFTEKMIRGGFIVQLSETSDVYVLSGKGRKVLELLEELVQVCRN